MLAYNYICPICGAHLDPEEKCDCESAARASPDPSLNVVFREWDYEMRGQISLFGEESEV